MAKFRLHFSRKDVSQYAGQSPWIIYKIEGSKVYWKNAGHFEGLFESNDDWVENVKLKNRRATKTKHYRDEYLEYDSLEELQRNNIDLFL